MSSASSTTRSSSRQSEDNKTLRRLGVDPSATLASAEKKNRGEMYKTGSYYDSDDTLSLDSDGEKDDSDLPFSDDESDGSDWKNNQNTPQKTTKKKRKKNRGAGKGAKKTDLILSDDELALEQQTKKQKKEKGKKKGGNGRKNGKLGWRATTNGYSSEVEVNKKGQSKALVKFGTDSYFNDPDKNFLAVHHNLKISNGQLSGQKLAECARNYTKLCSHSISSDFLGNRYGVLTFNSEEAMSAVALNMFFHKDKSGFSRNDLQNEITHSKFITLGSRPYSYAHKDFFPADQGKIDSIRHTDAGRKDCPILPNQLVMETVNGKFLAGVGRVADVSRHLKGEYNDKVRKSQFYRTLRDQANNVDLGRVEIYKIGSKRIFLRHAIKNGDYLGVSELGKATFQYDSKGKEWVVESESESESDN